MSMAIRDLVFRTAAFLTSLDMAPCRLLMVHTQLVVSGTPFGGDVILGVLKSMPSL